jgi:uncharacterized protein with PIN domain
MLGKLSRYLRMIGYDVEYVESDKDDSYIVNRSENNLILTRDKQLHEKLRNSVLIKSYSPIEQLEELKDKLPAPQHRFMELCSICGAVLEKTEVKEGLPDYVNRDAIEIFYCRNCDKFYWNGSHTENFRKIAERAGIEIL